MAAKNLTLDWWPVGTGPYMLVENDPNAAWCCRATPISAARPIPAKASGRPGRAAGRLRQADALHRQAVFTREKEAIPYWNKFLQGYYDASGVSSDNFDQAVRVNVGGDVALTDEMRDKGIRLLTSVKTSTFYMGFNMLDSVVGGLDERATKLRQAISIAIDQEEFISIFQNGRGIAAQSPLPPGISATGRRPGINPWSRLGWQAQRKPVRWPANCSPRRLSEWRDAKTASRWWSISIPPAAAWAKNRASTG
jgi:ABC-type transport system substrate-binding protein